jgi:hypothetical protein
MKSAGHAGLHKGNGIALDLWKNYWEDWKNLEME